MCEIPYSLELGKRMLDFLVQPLVETAWLAEHVSDTDLCIVDARWRGDSSSREVYRAGHIPGAVHLDWHWDLSWTNEAGIRDLLLPPERFTEMMSRIGIGDGKRVVAYAETDHSGAARLWWALHYYGYEQVAVLNGGWNKWVIEGRAVSAETPHPERAKFTPHMHSQWLATAAEIEQTVQRRNGSACLIDSRPIEQYVGNAIWTPFGSLYFPDGQHQLLLQDGRVMRGGHIPGAVHWHASTTFNPTDWTHLPAGILREYAYEKGIHPEQRVITYCGVGISASQGLFALYLAGYRNLALYDASWEEWGTDGKYPVEREE
ncbi:MAG: sulfurtransferase [Ktedonobacteraceae bacterium]